MKYNQNRAISLFGGILGNEISHIVYMEPVYEKNINVNRKKNEENKLD